MPPACRHCAGACCHNASYALHDKRCVRPSRAAPAPPPAGKMRPGKVGELFVYDNFSRMPVDEVEAGDICALR